MRTHGSPQELERRRCLAVQRLLEGCSVPEVADFLGVDARSVRRWWAAFADRGAGGLAARPAGGRPPKLSPTQEKIVQRWLADDPSEHGFAAGLWTAPRLAALIEQEWGIRFHREYLPTWLRARGLTPQRPRRQARERDPQAIDRWLARDWPRIKKRRGGGRRTCCGWTRAVC
jgi:transposase